MRWVALPAAPLDYSAQAEGRLLRRGLPYLRLVHRSRRWRIWEVRGTDPPASDGARVLAAGPDWFEVDARRTTVVRQRRVAPDLLAQLVRYGLVGATNTALTLAAYAALIYLGAPLAVAAATG